MPYRLSTGRASRSGLHVGGHHLNSRAAPSERSPLHLPNDPAFQRRVLTGALRLFEAPNGPVLADFAENALASGPLAAGLACPVDFTHEEVLLTDTEKLCAALKKEMASLRPWYDLAVKDRGRTTVGVSGLVVDAVGVFVCAFWTGTCRRLPGKTFLCPMPSTWQQTI